MLISSRSFDEYVGMFALTANDLSGTVLDCSAGAASFVAVAAERGVQGYAVDPAYALPRRDLAEAVHADLARGSTIALDHPDRFSWDWFGSPENREKMRRAAGARFLADIATRQHRYLAGELPRLPLRDRAVDLALCSHLLFTWADELGLDWHVAAALELVRVARREVRVFPTVVQGAGEPVPFWDEMLARLATYGIVARMQPVDYRFQLAADQMLVLASS